MDVALLAQALEGSALGTWMRGAWGYPLVNVLHLAGLVLLVGPIVLLDLRLLGAGRAFDADAVSRVLTPLAVAGLVLLLATGVMLFAADAGALVQHRLMQLKALAVALAVVNALWFRLAFARYLPHWDRDAPGPARASAACSIVLWTAVFVAGRMIAYV